MGLRNIDPEITLERAALAFGVPLGELQSRIDGAQGDDPTLSESTHLTFNELEDAQHADSLTRSHVENCTDCRELAELFRVDPSELQRLSDRMTWLLDEQESTSWLPSLIMVAAPAAVAVVALAVVFVIRTPNTLLKDQNPHAAATSKGYPTGLVLPYATGMSTASVPKGLIDDVTLGHEVGPDGAIEAGTAGDDFRAGELVHLAMDVGDIPAGATVRVVWMGPGDTRIEEMRTRVEMGERYLNFAADSSSWSSGDYRAVVWVGDEEVNSQQFQIQKADGKKSPQ